MLNAHGLHLLEMIMFKLQSTKAASVMFVCLFVCLLFVLHLFNNNNNNNNNNNKIFIYPAKWIS